MCISASVGKAAINNRSDVKILQVILNGWYWYNPQYWTRDWADLDENGRLGKQLLTSIEWLQTSVWPIKNPDGRIDADGKTIKRLGAEGPKQFSLSTLRGVMPNATPEDIKNYYQGLADGMAGYGIDKPLRIAHFLAQLAHESGEFRYAQEIATGDAYESRRDLGNTQKGDGRRFKGRGLIQLTGRANYQAYSNDTGVDYMTGDNPILIAANPLAAVDVACWYWDKHKLNKRSAV